MDILYGCSACSKRLYSEKFSKRKGFNGYAIQKYHHLLMTGLAYNGARVKCLSCLPINRSYTSKMYIHEKNECENGVEYHYYSTINFAFLHRLMAFFGGFLNTLFYKKDKGSTIAICDCLSVANAFGIAFAAKIRRIPLVLIVTDLPENEGGRGNLRKINELLFLIADGFVLLTPAMNQKVNRKKRPSIVLEGHVDKFQPTISKEEKWEYSLGKRIIIYAGSIMKKYGIKNLVDGFLLASIPNSELRVYGNGDYHDELVQVCSSNSCINYYGVIDNADVVKAEIRAALLVNPRPTSEEYTKYSFPSKNLEYMGTGTPVMTTKLPGMPEEYYPYVFLISDESASGIAEKIKDFFSASFDDRCLFGDRARDFVFQEKTNIMQSKKIIDFLKNNYQLTDGSD